MSEDEMDLQELRMAKGKSRADFARKLKVSVQTVFGWESGKQGIKDELVPDVAKEYGIRPQQLARYFIEKTRQRKANREAAGATAK